MNDEPEMDSEVLPQGVGYQAATLLYDDEITQAEKREALRVLEQLWDKDFTSAAYHLGRAYRDGLGLLPDDEKAEKWFRRSADTGNVHTLYVSPGGNSKVPSTHLAALRYRWSANRSLPTPAVLH